MKDPIIKKFGEVVRKKRIEKGLSQEKFAFTAELSSDYLRKIELGKTNASILVASRIAKALNIKLSELVKEL